MPSTTSLVKQLRRDFPDFTFSPGDRFYWSPKERAIYYDKTGDAVLLLHEVGHAMLSHANYRYDIELIKMEREAWDFTAATLAKKYIVEIADEKIEDMLDTYRNWLHDRSLCPHCKANGIQIAPSRYSCLACSSVWRVNEARSCALRRHTVKTAANNKK